MKHLTLTEPKARTSHLRRRGLVALLTAASMCAAWCPAAKAGTLTARLFGSLGLTSCLNAIAQDSAGPVSVAQNCTFDSARSSQGFAEADYGDLHASVAVQSTLPLNDTGHMIGNASAEFLGNYVFSGPAPTVTVALNLDLSGHLQRISGRGVAGAGLEIQLFGPSAGLLRLYDFLGSPPLIEDGLAQNAVDRLDLIGSDDAHLDIVTHSFVVPTNTPVALQLRLLAAGSLITGGSVESDFGSTLSFNAAGPVFTLPAGFTVNGDGVVDNRWVGAATDPGAVPEPGGLALAALGLALLARRVTSRRPGP